MTLSTLALLRGRTLAREGEKLLVRPAPSPEEARALASLKRPLLALLEEGDPLQGDDLLANLHLLAAILAAKEGIPPLTWATFYYEPRPEPERVLAPQESLLPHLRWRGRNLPEPRRVHLAATDGRLILDLKAPLEAFLRTEGEALELFAWPEWRMREYLWAAARGRAPQQAALEWRGQTYRGTWEELAQVVGPIRKVKLVI
ncbi:hypothetical protein [Thermus caliditerrae]|uniref:hypothetical protein n=1 Tax=Thermus caliditerrae TaxID=1330700 RepID=UPI001F2815DE|nr:hypothetical protein [Thermus caliditerrae]